MTVTGATGAPARSRIVWLDSAKGLGIILVVFGHALGGLIDSPIASDIGTFRTAFFVIYTFHMPLFFLLSGVLVATRIERDRTGFARTIGTDIVWPYLLWSVIQFTIIYLLGSAVNRPAEAYWPTILALPWKTVSQFWFLYALFLLHLLSLLTLRRLGAISFLIVCLALKPLPLIAPLPDVIRLAVNQVPYYGLGVFLGATGLQAVAVDRSRLVRLILLPAITAGLIALAFAHANGFHPTIRVETGKAADIAFLAWNFAVLPAALAGLFAAIGLASLLRGRALTLTAYLGRRSMPIFILHIMAIAGTRIILVSVVGVRDPYIVLTAIIVAGFIGPLVAFACLRRFGITRPLGLGRGE